MFWSEGVWCQWYIDFLSLVLWKQSVREMQNKAPRKYQYIFFLCNRSVLEIGVPPPTHFSGLTSINSSFWNPLLAILPSADCKLCLSLYSDWDLYVGPSGDWKPSISNQIGIMWLPCIKLDYKQTLTPKHNMQLYNSKIVRLLWFNVLMIHKNENTIRKHIFHCFPWSQNWITSLSIGYTIWLLQTLTLDIAPCSLLLGDGRAFAGVPDLPGPHFTDCAYSDVVHEIIGSVWMWISNHRFLSLRTMTTGWQRPPLWDTLITFLDKFGCAL